MKSLQFNLQVTCDNAAFDGNAAQELATILRTTANRLERGESFAGPIGAWLRDTNGNAVGTAKLRNVRK